MRTILSLTHETHIKGIRCELEFLRNIWKRLSRFDTEYNFTKQQKDCNRFQNTDFRDNCQSYSVLWHFSFDSFLFIMCLRVINGIKGTKRFISRNRIKRCLVTQLYVCILDTIFILHIRLINILFNIPSNSSVTTNSISFRSKWRDKNWFVLDIHWFCLICHFW